MSPAWPSEARPNLPNVAKKWSWPDSAPATKPFIDHAAITALRNPGSWSVSAAARWPAGHGAGFAPAMLAGPTERRSYGIDPLRNRGQLEDRDDVLEVDVAHVDAGHVELGDGREVDAPPFHDLGHPPQGQAPVVGLLLVGEDAEAGV